MAMIAHSFWSKYVRCSSLVLALLVCLTVVMPAGALAQQQDAPAVPAPQASPGTAVPELGPILTIPQPEVVKPEVLGITCPPEYVPLVQKTTMALMSDNFSFYPIKALDPFAPFISPDVGTTQVRVPGSEEEDEPKTDTDRPLTPLQRMTISEIQTGLKAITWGDLGRRAIIEDSTGKGYIVSVGTPAGDRNGVITQIMNDRLVVQQEIWDRKAKKRLAQDFIVKMTKKAEQ